MNTVNSRSKLKAEQVVKEGETLYKMCKFLARQGYVFSAEKFEKQLKTLPVDKYFLYQLEQGKGTNVDFGWFSLTYSPSGRLGPSGGGNLTCLSGWSIFFSRLKGTQQRIFDSVDAICQYAGVRIAKIDKYMYGLYP